MKMIPSTPYQTNSTAERRVFDWLRAIDQGFYVYHSLNLPSHPFKRFGECDFLLVGAKGLFVLEIKGGGVRRKGAEWTYIGRNGENTSREGPFKQAETAMHAIRTRLRDKFGDRSSSFSIGYGVVTPDDDIPPSAEWASATYAGRKQCRSFERWFNGFVRYWRDKKYNQRVVSDDFLLDINRYLRPDFDVMTPLYLQAQAAEDEIVSMTEGQLNFVDAVEENKRILCPGAAGTGKTLLAQELSKRWGSKGAKVLMLCYSLWLKNYLETRISLPNVTISTLKGVNATIRRRGIEKFDAIIVDEGQDLIRFEDLDRISDVLVNGLEEGRWCFFYDMNNQANLFESIDKDAINLLDECKQAIVPLKHNCRNSQPILDRIKSDLGVDLGVRSKSGVGPAVESVIVRSEQEAIQQLQGWIDLIIEDGAFGWGDITLLSPLPFRRSVAAHLGKKYRNHFQELDEFSMSQFPPQQMSFATVAQFKGLENRSVIIVDLPPPDLGDLLLQAQHYVAMSRASIVLKMIYVDPGGGSL